MTDEKKDLTWLLNKAYFFLKFRLRTKKELQEYLLKKSRNKDYSFSDIKTVVDQLEKQGLINDQEFIKSFVSQRLLFKPKSQFLLEKELLRLGVEKKDIDDYFAQNPIDEKKLAMKVLLKAWHRFKNLPNEKKFKKAVDFLLRRGFGYETATDVFKKLNLNNG
jgi:regulatory protein